MLSLEATTRQWMRRKRKKGRKRRKRRKNNSTANSQITIPSLEARAQCISEMTSPTTGEREKCKAQWELRTLLEENQVFNSADCHIINHLITLLLSRRKKIIHRFPAHENQGSSDCPNFYKFLIKCQCTLSLKGIKNLNNPRVYAIVDKQTSLSQDLDLNQSHEEEQ